MGAGWKEEHDRFAYPQCFGCTDPRQANPDFLHDLFAIRGEVPIVRLCKRCRRRWSRTSSGRRKAPHGYTLRLFRDAVAERYPDAVVVRYQPTPTGLQPRPFRIHDED